MSPVGPASPSPLRWARRTWGPAPTTTPTGRTSARSLSTTGTSRSALDILRGAKSVLLVDWPSREVPDSLVRAGYQVTAHGGPGPEDYSVYELRDGAITSHRRGAAPAHADLVYVFRPLSELSGNIELARLVGAECLWLQSGRTAQGDADARGCWLPAEDSRRARADVEAAGLAYVDSVSLLDALHLASLPPVPGVPAHLHTVTPRLVVGDGAGAIAFYQAAFGAVEEGGRFCDPSGRVIHAEIRIGDSVVMITEDASHEGPIRAPEAVGGVVTALLALYWEDVDTAWARAVAAGAEVLFPLETQFYGERGGRLRDPYGQQWMMGQHVEDVSPEEMRRRASVVQ